MPFDPGDVAAAVQRQQAAAQDDAPQVRLVAGPGTGKSYSIEDRVEHLLTSRISGSELSIISFTRASTADLEKRVRARCDTLGLDDGHSIRISTMHSLAMRLMRMANLLDLYPVEPRVLDDWELRHWIDEEFARFADVTPGRAKAVRQFHEAWWSTGEPDPPNYVPPKPPITAEEQSTFLAYHGMQTQFWACVLVGEIVRACLEQIRPGFIEPQQLLHISQLIVDEYQDLNPVDIEFIDSLTHGGVTTFVAGDDDQSIYSFRYASPLGIQTFPQRHPQAADHHLVHCFRCTPAVLTAAQTMLQRFASPSRIPKRVVSLYGTANPPLRGQARIWHFTSHTAEAAAVAQSCASLIEHGLKPGDMMILVCNLPVLGNPLYQALDDADVRYLPARGEPFSDTDSGRTGLSILRIVSDSDDLVAHRDLLGLLTKVGPGKCLKITISCTNANMSAKNLFYGNIPSGVLAPTLLDSVERVRSILKALDEWVLSDTLEVRRNDLGNLVESVRGADDRENWDDFTGSLPDGTQLVELRDLIFAENEEQSYRILVGIHERLGLDAPREADPDRVRVMTMHGVKGLSAKVVFIPGLEEELFPGPRRVGVPGLLQEGARLLFVSMTRATAAVICSYATRRFQHGKSTQHKASRYLPPIGVPVDRRHEGLTDGESAEIAAIAAAVDAYGKVSSGEDDPEDSGCDSE